MEPNPLPWQQEVIDKFESMPAQSGRAWLVGYLTAKYVDGGTDKTIDESNECKECGCVANRNYPNGHYPGCSVPGKNLEAQNTGLKEEAKKFSKAWTDQHRLHAAAIKQKEEELDLFRDELERVRTELTKTQMESAGALDLVSRIRFALGDNGKRMQDELIEYCKELAHNQSVLESLANGLKTQK